MDSHLRPIVQPRLKHAGQPSQPGGQQGNLVWPVTWIRPREQHVLADPSEILTTLMRHPACCVLPGSAMHWRGQRVRRASLGNTHPWRRYFNKRLHYHPRSLQELLEFLRGCTYLSDRATRSCRDFWEPPDLFDTRRSGDCEDHALWAWRCLVDMGVESRLVLGMTCGEGHAWVHVFAGGRCWLLEATQKWRGHPRSEYGGSWSELYTPWWSVQRQSPRKFLTFAHFAGERKTRTLQRVSA